MYKFRRRIVLTVVLLTIFVMAAPMAVEACGCEPPGVGTPGYWKNHPEAWPVGQIMVGGGLYTQEQAIAIMNTPGKGDKTFTMFNALIAASLNKLVYNQHDCIYWALGAGEWWLRAHPLGSNVRGNSQLWQGGHGEIAYWILDDYNNGLLCAPSRES